MNCQSIEFLELSNEILSKGSYLRFRAHGGSMSPFIRDGDILEIKPAEVSEIQLGDVIFYRTESRVAAHRVIRRVPGNGKVSLITKGDSSPTSDKPLHAEDLLGKVVTVERNGLRLSIDTRLRRLINLLWAKISPFSGYIYPPGIKLKRSIRRTLGKLLPYIQGLKLYRKLSKKLIKNEICYSIAVSDDALSLCRLYRYNEYQDIRDYTESFRERFNKPDDSEYCLIAKRRDKVIGSVTLKRTSKPDSSPYNGWWLSGMLISWPYRGLGIGKKLTKMACEIAAKNDAISVRLLAFERAKPAINLYRNLGFRQISIPEIDEYLREEAKKIRRQRIIMEKQL